MLKDGLKIVAVVLLLIAIAVMFEFLEKIGIGR